MPTPAWKNRNIFADVLHHEDALTDSLRNFLKYPIVQKSLRRTIGVQLPECVRFSKIEDIQTRPSGGSSRKQPDLVLYGPDFILVVEVKIGAKLTDAQKKAYVPWINGEMDLSKGEVQKGVVVFLIPDDYSHRGELDSCIEKAKAKLSNDSKIQVLDSITWQQFIREFGSQDIPAQNELIRQFYSHLSGRFKPVEFSREEISMMLSKETASGILQLRCIVEKVKSKPELDKLKKSRLNTYDYGYDFSSAGSKTSVYFGIWHEFWASKGFPLCIALSIDSKVQTPRPNDSFQRRKRKFGTIDPDPVFEDEGGERWPAVGFKLPGPGEDCGKLIEEIVKEIENLLREGGN